MYEEQWAGHRRVLAALGLQSLVTIGLFLVDDWRNSSDQYWYFIWNLVLAWLPLVFAYGLTKWLDAKHPWISWQGILLSLLWLGFLPNSFYMVSDFIHLGDVPRVDPLFDVIMFSSFVLSGLVLGFTSLYLVHRQLIKRFTRSVAHTSVGLIFFLSSFAIYLGRDLRWNTWDILINPAGILFAVSDPIINPRDNPQAFSTTFGFFVLLGTVYIVLWQFAQALPARKHT